MNATHPPQLQALGGDGGDQQTRLLLPVAQAGVNLPGFQGLGGEGATDPRNTKRSPLSPYLPPSSIPGSGGPRVDQKTPLSSLRSLPLLFSHPRERQSPGVGGRRPRAAESLHWPCPERRLGGTLTH